MNRITKGNKAEHIAERGEIVIEAIIYQHLNPTDEIKDKVSRRLEAFVQRIEAMMREIRQFGVEDLEGLLAKGRAPMSTEPRIDLISVSLVIAPFMRGSVRACLEVQLESELFEQERIRRLDWVEQRIVPSVEGVIGKAHNSMMIFRPMSSIMSNVNFEKSFHKL